MVMRITLNIFFIVALLTGCSNTDDTVDKEASVELLYNRAFSQLRSGTYGLAAKGFLEVDRQHPYSDWATKAQLMAAFCYYQSNKYDDAILSLERFVRIHPSNSNVPYAFYLKAISYYEQISDVGRDQKMTRLALKSLNEILVRFPDSKYARDSSLKIDLARDHLAGKEMEIGRYYERKGYYLAAINRYKQVIEKFQTTTHVPEALHRLTESYLAIGLKEQANKTASVLGHNFPGSDWYVDSFKIIKGKTFLEDKKKKYWYWPFN
ncbi:MAG: outer membrane protein assembly factor BamD [Rhodospirillaceae bacterium]|nr:outer membrane protein assembly factor BamD [Rhodospirillaceae bacterium]OUT77045.1 MAG: outer membrane protein assembly factor BamD [Rhodospirillaceae bacterium TMED23]|tara:strand:+ start:294 stop:1088 length:795 start_codon:yes stop_codon:yes gene_type:complete